MENKLILASESPRRRDLLEMLGIDLVIEPSRIDESFIESEDPRGHSVRLALEKARAIALKHPGHWVLGADTVVAV